MPARHAARVVTIHDLDFLDHPERTSAEIRRDYPDLVRSHAARADHIVTISQFTAGEIQRRLGVAADKITVACPGAPEWSPRDAMPTPGYVLFLGTLEPRKNLGGLLDAYSDLVATRPNAPRLVLAGRLGEAAMELTSRLNSAPLAGRVDLPGYIAPDDRRSLMAGAAVLVMPSFMEGFGIPALEAMTLGVPVIVSNRGALPEVVGDAGLIFDPDQQGALAAALGRVLDDEPLRQTLSARGIGRARNYTWRAAAAQTRNAWLAAIDTRKARPHG
jgi:alpha-1,3-rhamnosyl/mannosyltransferase